MAWKSFPKNLKESSKINSLHSIKKKSFALSQKFTFPPLLETESRRKWALDIRFRGNSRSNKKKPDHRKSGKN
jgi:hypothetical protein